MAGLQGKRRPAISMSLPKELDCGSGVTCRRRLMSQYGRDPALDAHSAWSAMVSKAAAARAAATRTWFHAVHFVTYSSQRSAASEPWVSSVARPSLSGTLHAIVT